MAYLQTDFYAPQLAAGQVQEQQDVHQLRLAEIAKSKQAVNEQAILKEEAARIYGPQGTGVQQPQGGPLSQMAGGDQGGAAPSEEQSYLQSMAQQTQSAQQQRQMGENLAKRGLPQRAAKYFDNYVKLQKDIDISKKDHLAAKEKQAERIGAVFNQIEDQGSWDIAREQMQEIDPAAAAKMPLIYTEAEGKKAKQLAQSSMLVKDQLSREQAILKEKETQDYHKAMIEESQKRRDETKSEHAINREGKIEALTEKKREFDIKQQKEKAKVSKIMENRPSDVKAASEMIKGDFKGMSQAERDNAAEHIISRTKQIQVESLKADTPITFGDARDQAYDEIKAQFGTTQKTIAGIPYGSKVATYKGSKGTQPVAGQYTESAPAKPTSQETFAKLPSGTWFINPADGKKMKKK